MPFQVEEQEWPVTPYQIKIYAQRHCPNSWYYVYVDGVCVNWNVLDSGKEWLVLQSWLLSQNHILGNIGMGGS